MISARDADLLLAELKTTVRPMEWQNKPGQQDPQWMTFFSACEIDSSIIEGLMFRVMFRARKTRYANAASVDLPETYSFGLHFEKHRIAGMDFSDTPHTNIIGSGRPYFRQTIIGCHKHIWTDEGYGYAEPIQGEVHGIEGLAQRFQDEFSLVIPGGFVHPLHGTQLGLPL